MLKTSLFVLLCGVALALAGPISLSDEKLDKPAVETVEKELSKETVVETVEKEATKESVVETVEKELPKETEGETNLPIATEKIAEEHVPEKTAEELAPPAAEKAYETDVMEAIAPATPVVPSAVTEAAETEKNVPELPSTSEPKYNPKPSKSDYIADLLKQIEQDRQRALKELADLLDLVSQINGIRPPRFPGYKRIPIRRH